MPEPIAKSRGLRGAKGRARATARIFWHTVTACLRFRVTGLAAEVAFFAILSLPPLIFGLTGSIGLVMQQIPVTTKETFRAQILHYSERFLTPDAVSQLLAPTLDEVLGTSRFDVISIGFLIALWSGSRAMAVFVDTISIMYGMAGERGIVRTRVLSFGVYLAFMLGSGLVLPFLVAGPGLLQRIFSAAPWISELYWPVVVVGSVVVLGTLLHLATPLKQYWRSHLPGAALTIAFWLLGSWILRLVMVKASNTTSIYGPLSAPIALLAFLYLIAFAVLVGSALNAAVAKVAPRFAGISATDAEHVLDDDADAS